MKHAELKLRAVSGCDLTAALIQSGAEGRCVEITLVDANGERGCAWFGRAQALLLADTLEHFAQHATDSPEPRRAFTTTCDCEP